MLVGGVRHQRTPRPRTCLAMWSSSCTSSGLSEDAADAGACAGAVSPSAVASRLRRLQNENEAHVSTWMGHVICPCVFF